MIRKATPNDIPSIIKLLGEVLYVHYEVRPDIFKSQGSKYTNQELINIINDPNYLVFVDEEDGNVVAHLFGEIRITKSSSNRNDLKEFFIDDLCVTKEYAHHGIGKALMEYAERYAKDNNFDIVTLNVWDANKKAKAFYESLNYKPQSIKLEKKIK